MLFLALTSLLLQLAAATCPFGLISDLSGNGCYLLSSTRLSWANAERQCTSGGGHLTSVSNAFERQLLFAEVIDGADFSFADVWSGGFKLPDSTTWQWTDETPFSYQQWKPGFPIDDSSATCIALDTQALFTNVYCLLQKYYICKFPTTLTATCPACSCPFGYELHKGFCYKVAIPQLTFDQAEDFCVQEGGHLASIHSRDENTFIFGKIDSNFLSSALLALAMAQKTEWEGSPCDDPVYTAVRIGLSDPLQNRNWSWTDGTPFNYSNWNPGQPANECLHNEYCVGMYPHTGWRGTWNDLECAHNTIMFVCKQPAQ